MKKFFEGISIIREIILFAITAIIFTVLYLLILPALWGWGFWGIVMLSCLPAGIYGLFLRFSYGYEDEHSIVSWLTTTTIACTIVVMLVLWIGGGAMVQPITTANSHTYETVETTENLPTEEDIQNLILMDTASATKLGDRAVGSLSEYVSQYEVSMQYTTISYNGKSYKIAPLAHGSYFKAMQNETIPGYVLVDASAGADLNSNKKQEFIKVEGGIKYSPSAYFGKDLLRHVRSKYKTEVIRRDYYNFQIDDEGTPYWVLTVYDYAVWASCPVPYEAILVNAVNGDMEKYKLADLPLWVDQAVNGDAASEMYNRYGSFNNGFWNSLFAKKGCTQTTDDYGYVNIDNCIYTYTGVTSVGSDESNIGFMLSNTRTGVSKYYPNMVFSEDNSDNEITGAEEYSAMGNAESAVQNYGYKASFPTLAIIDGAPTYVMVLKGDNGLVKKYAMVNYIDYSILAVEDDIQECLKSYRRAINKTGAVVSDIEFVIVNGETIVYIKTSDGKVYKERFAENESLITISKDDKVNIEVSTPDTEIPFAHITK